VTTNGATTGRVKGFADWKPQKRTVPLLLDIEDVLREYAAYLPLSVRQVFYRLVGRGYPKTESFYNNVQDKCNRGRRSGLIEFAAIRDDGVSRQGGETSACYDSPEGYYSTHEQLHNHYLRSLHADQPTFVMVLCEAAGMVPMIARAVQPYRVGVASSSGFDSLTVKHELYADAVARMEEHDQDTLLLHLGDHDPSGVSLHESLSQDLAQFAADAGHDGLIRVERVALTLAQIVRFGVEPQPGGVKPSDSRSASFIARGLEPAAQLEAIPPDALTDLVRGAVRDALDLDLLHESAERECQERREVQEKLDAVNVALSEAFGLD
jgi:hypothetical protein